MENTSWKTAPWVSALVGEVDGRDQRDGMHIPTAHIHIHMLTPVPSGLGGENFHEAILQPPGPNGSNDFSELTPRWVKDASSSLNRGQE